MELLLKLLVMALLAPLWWPMLRALYREVQGALWKEGGLFGHKLGPVELKRRFGEARLRESPLVHEPLVGRYGKSAGKPVSTGPRPRAGAAGSRSATRVDRPRRF